MISANDFYEYYKKLSNAELINILDTPNNYEPVAIEAAKKIVALRNLTDTEIDEARKSLDESKNENIKRQEHLKK